MSDPAAKRLGRRVYRRARKLSATTTEPGGHTKWGDRLQAGTAPKLKEHHKTDIFAGMVRQEKTYAKATQSQYTTFRAVSDKSDDASWLHPGIEGQHLFEEVAGEIGGIATRLFAAALSGVQG